ncbi:hypothetical protein [Pararhizobium sp. LjRoot238]
MPAPIVFWVLTLETAKEQALSGLPGLDENEWLKRSCRAAEAAP